MHHITLIGLNHKTAPVALRECIALSPDETIAMQAGLGEHPDISETVVFSTCNRVEVLMAAKKPENAVQVAKAFLARTKKVPVAQFENALYVHHDAAAFRHLFRVASSLDSMVVGEPQILGQIKEAYLAATRQKTSGPLLNRLLHRAFSVAKRIRTETGIGDRAVSISFAAVELGRKIFGTLENKKVMLIGAGEMAELAMEHLVRQRVGEIIVANRTFERGVAIARRFNGQAIRFDECQAYLKLVDVIIGSTGAKGYVITRDQVKRSLRGRRNRPLFFIDIAVPRDIDPQINRLANCYVYDIDDLKGVVDENIQDRKEEAVKGERIVEEGVVHFQQWYESLSVVPTIVALRKKIEAIVDGEIQHTLSSLNGLSDADRQALGRMRNALVKKVLHHPTAFLKRNGCQKDRTIYLDVARKLFDIDE
ncbi:MAG: glutamyl-tRNA reductase [Deltaproteobacteria bacterium]|nr:MAG: glutamyl-tRNA reductase [Deltaproteobacteria bacterium]